MSAERSNIDFTKGNIGIQLTVFALPIIAGELLQNLYHSVDSLVVGNCIGGNALAAVSVCATLTNLMIGFFNGMSLGASVIVSRAFGKGDRKGLLLSMKVAFSFSVVLGVALSVAGLVFAPALVRISNVQEEIYLAAVTYLRIYLMGTVFTVIYNISAGVLRAIGNSRTPLCILAVTCGVNIALDLLLAAVLPWGIAGVGIATVIAQGLSVLLVYRRLRREMPEFHFDLPEMRSNLTVVSAMTRIGVPSGMQSALISFSNLFVWRYTSRFDSVAAIAGIGAAQRLDRFVGMPAKAVGLAVTTFVSQNEGAGNHRRAQKGARSAACLSMEVVTVLGCTVYLLADRLVALFNSSPEVVAVGTEMMRTLIPFYTFMGLRDVWTGVLRGYGYVQGPMILSLMGIVGVRQLFLAVLMERSPSLQVIFWCYPVAWAASALFVGVYYRIKMHRLRKAVPAEPNT